MGSWTIVIHGHGQHDNSDELRDVDQLFKQFTKTLKSAGHHIEHAAITIGSGTEFTPGNADQPDGLRSF